jgi:hypothetical protein
VIFRILDTHRTPTPLVWLMGPTDYYDPNLLQQSVFFENVSVALGRAVLEAPEPFCGVLVPLI